MARRSSAMLAELDMVKGATVYDVAASRSSAA